jgi:hypothetical protein
MTLWLIGSGRDRMVVEFTTTYAINTYHHWCCEFESRSGWGVKHYVIKFVSDLWQINGFLRVLRFPPPFLKVLILQILDFLNIKYFTIHTIPTMFNFLSFVIIYLGESTFMCDILHDLWPFNLLCVPEGREAKTCTGIQFRASGVQMYNVHISY